MSDPASCIPPNPEVSGWWWLIDNDIPTPEFPVWWESIHQEWDMGDVAVTAGEIAQKGYRILGPVPSHADVEALRAELRDSLFVTRRLQDDAVSISNQLTAANAAIETLEALRDVHAYALPHLDAQLTAANAEIARQKHEIASLRLTLGGTTFSADIPEPIGCPMPGMCAKVRALSMAQDEIARLKHPDLVTVRREDLRSLIGRASPCTKFEKTKIEQRIVDMEDAVNGT